MTRGMTAASLWSCVPAPAGRRPLFFAADLYRMYTPCAAARGWQVELMNAGETELGGYREIVFSIEGEKVFSPLKV